MKGCTTLPGSMPSTLDEQQCGFFYVPEDCDSPEGLETHSTWLLLSHVTFKVICWEPSRIACVERLTELVFAIFLGVFYLPLFPGITMWLVSLMCQNLVSGLHYLVNVLFKTFRFKSWHASHRVLLNRVTQSRVTSNGVTRKRVTIKIQEVKKIKK